VLAGCGLRDAARGSDASTGADSERPGTSVAASDERFTFDESFVGGREAIEIGAADAGSMRCGVTCRMGVTEPIQTKDPKVTANIASLMSNERTIL
jgi:hypothetical protein